MRCLLLMRREGVFIEVPVMLLAVRVVDRSGDWYEAKPGVPA